MTESNWRDLCERIGHETNPEELMTLVEELNRTLARQERAATPERERNRGTILKKQPAPTGLPLKEE